MKHATRSLIRHLYFVEHLAVDVIASELGLRPRTVRRALVLRGGAARSATVRATTPTTPTPEDPS